MHKVMVFIDYQNFNINLKEHYKNTRQEFKSINYKELGKQINELIPFQSEVIKTYVFAYEPCKDLMQLESYRKYYEWLEKLKSAKYLEVIEGRQEIRTFKNVQFDINDPDTYTTIEKETDINLATYMVSMGFQNAYDIAVLVSGDTDYVKVVETLHNIGKTVVIAHLPHQNVHKYDKICDANIVLYGDILNRASNIKKKTDDEKLDDEEKEDTN